MQRPEWRDALLAIISLIPVLAIAQSLGSSGSAEQALPTYGAQTVLALLVVIFLNALFVAADAALESLRPGLIRSNEKYIAYVDRLQAMFDRKQELIAACALGSITMRSWMIILCFVPAPALSRGLGTWVAWPSEWVGVIATATLLSLPVAAVNVVVGELLPRSIGSAHPQRVALATIRLVRAFAFIFALPNRAMLALANLLAKRFGVQASYSIPRQAEDEIRSIVESAEESGELEEEERELLHSVFEFGDTVAREVMTPRVDLDAAPASSSVAELAALIQSTGHSRIPLYENTDDQIIGMIHAKDLLLLPQNTEQPINLRTIIRPVLFVPESKDLHDLLREMRLHRTPMAIVQDEFGGTAGLVTIEDIVEELVGDIVDEYDQVERSILRNGTGWIVEGRVNLYDLNEEIGSDLESEEFDTVGGFVFGLFGRQPQPGESLEHGGYRFTVDETDGRRIVRLHVEEIAAEDGVLSELLG